MNAETARSWHVARWPALAWLETLLKLAALAIGIMAGWEAIANPEFRLPLGWQLVAFIVLILLSLGLLAAVIDRWIEKEVSAMLFVVINNLGHWGMVVGLATPPWPERMLLLFAILMLLGDLVKVWFIRAHRFTVRDYAPAVLMRLTAVYILGYTVLLLVELLG